MTPADLLRGLESGMAHCVRLNQNTVAVNCRCYDPMTGKEGDPIAMQYNLVEFRNQIEAAEKGLAVLQGLMKHFEGAKGLGG